MQLTTNEGDVQRDPVASTIASRLKLAIVSPNEATMRHLVEMLRAWNPGHGTTAYQGGIEQLGRIAEQERPDVMIVEGVRADHDELVALERVTTRHPQMAVILLSPNQTPDFLRHGMRIGLRELLPMPVPKESLFEAIGRVQQRLTAAAPAEKTGRVISLIGAKGGSGTTFIAANLAYALAAETELRVALLDLNSQFGDAALYICDRHHPTNLADVARQIHRIDGSLLASSMLEVLPNFHVLPAPDEPEQALHVRPEHIDALLWVAASHYDFVIVDAGRSLDGIALRAMDQSEQILLVLQLGLPFLRDSHRLLSALLALGYGRDKVHLIINRLEKRGDIVLDDAVQALKHSVFHTLPNSFQTVAASINQGVPVMKLAPRDPVSKSLREMASALAPVTQTSGGWLSSLLHRRA
jgi:pilus assembly protein CpaE